MTFDNEDHLVSAAADDRVESLPGAPALLSKHYSGFLQITGSKRIHYYYIESENNPVTDSIVFWTNGGPGCSGLLGLFVELGPFRPQSDLTLIRNPHTWTSLASIVFLEQPAGVGFSTTSNPSELRTNDYNAAHDNIRTIRKFFERHPERANNTIYLASESYGGHYIPQLTVVLLEDEVLSRNFGGFLVGNPYTSFSSGELATVSTLWGLQLVDYPRWQTFKSNLCEKLDLNAYTLPSACYFTLASILKSNFLNPYALNFPVCNAGAGRTERNTKNEALWSHSGQAQSIRKMSKRLEEFRELYPGDAERSSLNVKHYAHMFSSPSSSSSSGIFAASSSSSGSSSSSSSSSAIYEAHTDNKNKNTFSRRTVAVEDPVQLLRNVPRPTERGLNEGMHPQGIFKTTSDKLVEVPYEPCTQDYTVSYLNNAAVQYALHVIPSATSKTVEWRVCSDPLFLDWPLTDMYADTTGLYSEIYHTVRKQRESGERKKDFKMLVFSGDSDGICATVGTQHWIYAVTKPIASLDMDFSLPLNYTASTVSGAQASLKATESTASLWKPWYISKNSTNPDRSPKLGGFLTTFEGSFSFATVHTAGHEVPAYQPAAALVVFTSFLDGSFFSPLVINTPAAAAAATASNAVAVATEALLVLAALSLIAVCFFMYRRERKNRAGSSGPPVSMIESAEEEEGQRGPGTLTARVPTLTAASVRKGGNYAPMATEDTSI